MRIAFLGKGGAGKTTTAAGFAKFVAKKHPFVLAIDADVNMHLQTTLGMQGTTKKLGQLFDEIADYLRAKRSDLGDCPLIGTTPPSSMSNFIRVAADDTFIQKYALQENNIALLTVGTYLEDDVDTGTCFHSKLHSAETVFHHLLDGQNDVVIADTTAGTDNVATSLSFVYDLNIFVIEPTLKSLAVYKDFCRITPHLSNKILVVGNKVDNREDEAFIKSNVDVRHYLGSILISSHLKRFEQGHYESFEKFMTEQEELFNAIYTLLLKQKRDWVEYLETLRGSHTRVCLSYVNTQYGMPIENVYEHEFNYESVLRDQLSDQVQGKADRNMVAAAVT